jgi:biotin synthase
MDTRGDKMIRVSVGTAGVLGLAQVPMDVAPTTAYLLVGGRCAMSCAFCAQARESSASNMALSRVMWPEFPLDEVCVRMRQAELLGQLRRCCIQVTASHDHMGHTMEAVHTIRASVGLPLDISILPTGLGQVEALIAAGVERIGFGLDAACERVFLRAKGAHWDRVLWFIEETARRFPGHVAIHLIVGLGETEEEAISRMFWARGLGATLGLFAFTPLRGTLLAEASPPLLGHYRRVQAALWLIMEQGASPSDFAFGDVHSRPGSLIGIRIPDWATLLAESRAFETSGCPGCNRPFYNEHPGGPIYNYPRALSPAEILQATGELELGD